MDDESKVVLTEQKLLNGVQYESLPETSIAISRNWTKQYFAKTNYTSGQDMVCDLNTGAMFVNTRRSYLAITMTVSTSSIGGVQQYLTFGHGSVCNIIQRVVVQTRSGVELSRCDFYNILMAKRLRYESAPDWISTNGQVMGMSPEGSPAVALPAAAVANQIFSGLTPVLQFNVNNTFLIPLDLLSPFFEGDGRSLLPPQAAAGLRITITLAPDAQALYGGAQAFAVATTYSISDVYIMTSVTQMADSWQKEINEESATAGLTWSYPEWHTTFASLPAGQATTNIETRKAVARCMQAFVVACSLAPSILSDNMKSDTLVFPQGTFQFQWRLGSLYSTQQYITNYQEAYQLAQNLFDGGILSNKGPNSVSLQKFITSTVTPAANNANPSDGDGAIAVLLERNDVMLNGVLNIAGLPTNSSRVLAINLQFGDAPVARQLYLFMKHLRVAKFFLDNSVVSE